MPILKERVAWSRPKKPRGPDLSPDERARVKAALVFLRCRYGSLRALAEAMGLKFATVGYAVSKRGNPSAGVALRAARAAGVPLEDVLSGAYPKPGACPRCGRS
jgi:transcriptional regulator with XRE-family HTH domain